MNVTVCIPTWNGDRYVAETIQSVLAQTYTEFECLLVDDGSTDRTLDIVDSFKDSRIRRHINPKQLGIANNYNRCLELARGDFICVFQQDDVMRPDNLARKLAFLRADPDVSFVHSSSQMLSSASELGEIVDRYAATDQTFDGNKIFRELLLTENHICNPTVVARRQFMLEVGGYDSQADYTCDYEIWMKMSVDHKVGFLADPLVKYRWHDTNSSHRFVADVRRRQLERAREQALRHYENSGAPYAELLRFALEQVTRLEGSAVELEKGRLWFEKQMNNWHQEAEKITQQFNDTQQRWTETERQLKHELNEANEELQRIKNSRTWRWASKLRSLLAFGMKRRMTR
jgi:glycosyltransferase involved in cell wall biosynthesis